MRFAHFEFDPRTDRLGEGPSSEIYQAVDTRLGRTVALKILRPHIEFDPQAKERFEREAKHTSNLAHPNIATVYEYGQDRGASYIAMEYLEGRTLDKMLRDRRLDYDRGLSIALQVASALELVHERGLVHRDLKPANIMVMADGVVKLLDFGICRSTGESNITQEGMLVGTVLYMAPEQVLGEDVTPQTDVFAFGSVFYHAFSGELPFPGKSFPEVCLSILEAKPKRPAQVRPDVPPALEELLLRCLKRAPEDRYPSGAALHGALLAVFDDVRMRARAERPSTPEGRIWIPPFAVGGSASEKELFAGGVRRDLSSELGRSTNLDVSLVSDQEAGAVAGEGFVLRGSLALEGHHAVMDYVLERGRNGSGKDESGMLWRERVEHSDSDEWGLQAKLVGSVARAVRRRLAEYALTPPPEARRDPAKAENLARRAHEMLHRGTTRHLIAALSIFRRALQEDPSSTLVHAGLAEAMARKFVYWDGDATFLQEAREAAQRALSLDPFSAEAHTSRGFAALVSGDLSEAQRELRLAIQIDHDEWLAHRLLGALLGRTGDLDGASPLLQRAIALHPTHIGSHDHLYGVLCRLDRYQEAIGIADRGIATAKRHLQEVPDDQEARLHMALLLARMGLAEEAREVVHEARRLAPKDAYTAYHAACVHALLGDLEEPLALLREARERGFYLRSEALRNPDLETVRSRPEFQTLV